MEDFVMCAVMLVILLPPIFQRISQSSNQDQQSGRRAQC